MRVYTVRAQGSVEIFTTAKKAVFFACKNYGLHMYIDDSSHIPGTLRPPRPQFTKTDLFNIFNETGELLIHCQATIIKVGSQEVR